MSFKLTYSTMFDPPEEMHDRFEAALTAVRACLGARYGHFIGGRDQSSEVNTTLRSPADQRLVLGHFAKGSVEDAHAAMAAGFTHLGEFGLKYRERFGETPNATRKRAPSKPSRPGGPRHLPSASAWCGAWASCWRSGPTPSAPP